MVLLKFCFQKTKVPASIGNSALFFQQSNRADFASLLMCSLGLTATLFSERSYSTSDSLCMKLGLNSQRGNGVGGGRRSKMLEIIT